MATRGGSGSGYSSVPPTNDSGSPNDPAAVAAAHSASVPEPIASASAASRGRISPPDRSLDRCHELGQLSLRCQMNAQIRLNQKSNNQYVQDACRDEIEAYLICHRRAQDRKKHF